MINKDLFILQDKYSTFYNTRIKTYGSDYVKITCFNRSVFNGDKLEVHKPLKTLVNQEKEENQHFKKCSLKDTPEEIKQLFNISEKVEREERLDSIKRSKDKVFEIAYSNDFEYFITITIDENKLSRTDTKEIVRKCNRLFSNLVQRKNFKYILIAEYHERYEITGEKAIHFHGLISGDKLKMVDSGKIFKGQKIYNWNDWSYGYSTAIELDNNKFICQYITKYITKDTNKIFGKFYFSGGKLKRTVPTQYCNTDYADFDGIEVEVLKNVLSVKYQTVDL